MLTGKLPFEAGDSSELAQLHRSAVPVPPRRLNPAIPEALEEITLKVLSKEPAARYRTADQLGRVLINFGQLNREKTGPIILPQAGNHQTAPSEEAQPAPSFTPPLEETPLPVEPETGEISEQSQPLDWQTWVLALLAFTTVLGLIPFWLFIYFTINP
jgi:serine/threonine-protein kinase